MTMTNGHRSRTWMAWGAAILTITFGFKREAEDQSSSAVMNGATLA